LLHLPAAAKLTGRIAVNTEGSHTKLEHYDDGSTYLGYSAWFYNGTSTVNIGLAGMPSCQGQSVFHDAEESQESSGLIGEFAKGGGNFSAAGQSEGGDGGVTKGSQVLRCVTGLHLALVFAEGDVADPVEAIFDSPVVAPAGQEQRRVGARGGDTGNRVLDFGRLLTAASGGPLQSADLLEAWPVEMLGQPRAGFKTPHDGAAVALGNGAGLGE
jgi:hypothetical protein